MSALEVKTEQSSNDNAAESAELSGTAETQPQITQRADDFTTTATNSIPPASSSTVFSAQSASTPQLIDAYRAVTNGSEPTYNIAAIQNAITQNGAQQPTITQPGSYYQAHPAMQYQPMQYPIGTADQHMSSARSSKKEIKRRTKTGCLTCRKRRIKCDELHPHCRNCLKSKRDCLGYDPVFKAPNATPTNIQPAPISAPLTNNTYGAQPLVPTSTYLHPTLPYDDALSAGLNINSAGQYAYTAVDATHVSAQMAAHYKPRTIPGKFKMEALIDQGGMAAPVTPAITNQLSNTQTMEEIKIMFSSIYSPGLESFFESKWFTSKGLTKLLNDPPTLEQFVILIERFTLTQDNDDTAAMSFTASVEARVSWTLACMIRSAAAAENSSNRSTFPAADDVREGASRLSVFENLITGGVAPNTCTRPTSQSIEPQRIRELEFWFQLAHFVSLVDDGSQLYHQAAESSMTTLRGLLDGRENRDVLYSIVVVRALGPRVAEYSQNDEPLHLDETDARSKLAVAKKFVNDEGAGAGTTNVIRRFCELAARSWSQSGAQTVTAT